jgi:hypothetical protein
MENLMMKINKRKSLQKCLAMSGDEIRGLLHPDRATLEATQASVPPAAHITV